MPAASKYARLAGAGGAFAVEDVQLLLVCSVTSQGPVITIADYLALSNG